MKSFKDFFINEAIDLWQAKEKKMTRKSSEAYKFPELNRVFSKKDRLIYDFDLDLDTSFEKEEKNRESAYNKTKDFLETNGFIIPSMKFYIKGFCLKPNDKNTYKIGKVLEKLDQPTVQRMDRDENIKEVLMYTHMFKTDSIRHVKDEPVKIVISRHPYDIYGMSTGRMWTSCMDMKLGSNSEYLKHEVKKGTLVAYVIPASEVNQTGKAQLKKPVSRIALKPLRNRENELGYGVGNPYGANISKFVDFCKKWVNQNFNSLVKNKEGFKLEKDVYDDPYSCDDLEEENPQMLEMRKTLEFMEEHKNEMLSSISAKDRPKVNVWFHPEFNEFKNEYEYHGGIYWVEENVNAKSYLSGAMTKMFTREDVVNPVFVKVVNNLKINYPQIYTNKYYRGAGLNGRLNLFKLRFGSDTGTYKTYWDFNELLRDFLMKIYPFLRS